MTKLLSASGIWMDYGGHPIIDGASISANAGEIVALTGPNGSGKSTLLRGLAGLQPMLCDTYTLRGANASVNSREHRELTCAIMDSASWLPDLTLADHLLAAHTGHEDSLALTPHEALDALGLWGLENRLPHQLSSGQRQRAALSLGLVREWSILFLDEPEQRLDVAYQGILAELLTELVSVGERAIIMATHSRTLLENTGAREYPIAQEPGEG